MSDATDPGTNEVRIDRLSLDIPGLDPRRAAAIAERVGFGLAGLETPAKRDRLAVTLSPFDDDGDDDALAARIVAALHERLA